MEFEGYRFWYVSVPVAVSVLTAVVLATGPLIADAPKDAFLPGAELPYYGSVDTWDRRWFQFEYGHVSFGRRGQHAMLEVQEGRTDRAISECEQLLEADPQDQEILFGLVVAHCQKGDADRAWTTAQRALAAGLPLGRFLAGPRSLLMPLVAHPEFQQLAKQRDIRLLHGPLVGCVTHRSTRFWVRTTDVANVEVVVRLAEDSHRTRRSSVASTDPQRDYTAVVEVRGLQPARRYDYDVLIDGVVRSGSPRPSFRTYPPPGQAARFEVGFGGGALYYPPKERMWDTIASHSLSAFLLLGDNVYIDLPQEVSPFHHYTYYRRQSRPEFRRLVASTSIYAIWDDHDCAIDDCYMGPFVDKPAWKPSMWHLFRNNWNNPAYGTPPKQPGCWFRFAIGDVDFFLLDGRYYRTHPKAKDASMLGPVQKKWLFDAMKQSRATFKVLISPVPYSYKAKNSPDTWSGYRRERDEIFDFLTQNRIEGVFLLAADRHRSDAWRIDREGDYPLYEFMSSCLTHQKHLIVDIKPESLYGYNDKCSFGVLAFDTEKADPEVTYKIISIDNEPVWEMTLKRSQLEK